MYRTNLIVIIMLHDHAYREGGGVELSGASDWNHDVVLKYFQCQFSRYLHSCFLLGTGWPPQKEDNKLVLSIFILNLLPPPFLFLPLVELVLVES